MAIWNVTLPIAGHAFLTVEADDEGAAIEAALGEVTLSDIEDWEAMETFSQGNVLYCPRPWDASAEREDEA